MKNAGILLVLISLATSLNAHVVSSSHLRIEPVETGFWKISMELKTAEIRRKVLAARPDLEGQSMNSDDFKNTALSYLNGCFKLELDGHLMQTESVSIDFGGHQSQAEFQIKSPVFEPQKLQLTNSCFCEEGQHVLNEAIVIWQGKIMTHNLSESHNQVEFDFEKGYFLQNEPESDHSPAPEEGATWLPILITVGGILGIVLLVYWLRKG
ncbi:MAG: hypothetical protein H6581_05030 [Bacteroidia bacterium]|nr:hypothetical protein [Bacteroidia bacterium]